MFFWSGKGGSNSRPQPWQGLVSCKILSYSVTNTAYLCHFCLVISNSVQYCIPYSAVWESSTLSDLSTESKRLRLTKRREPYWQRLHKGCYLGFRRGPNTWIARYTQRNNGKYRYQYKAIDANAFDEAKDVARAWFGHLGSSAARVVRRGSVRDALETYTKILIEQGRQTTADNAADRFRLIVWNDPIAEIKLEDLTRQDFREWRERLGTGRQNRSVNRHVRSVVAGLNVAIREGHTGNQEAWALKPLADDTEAGGTAIVFIRQMQRTAIIKAASPMCAAFLQAIEYTGGRPGELAGATVADLDKQGGTLILRHKKGRPATVRARAVELSTAGLAFFSDLARSKLPNAPLLVDPNGKHWNRHKWADEVQAAIAAVNANAKGQSRIPKGTSAYSYRHARISEMLQLGKIDPVTVGHQTGTSVRMIETSYFKFIGSAMRAKLDAMESR